MKKYIKILINCLIFILIFLIADIIFFYIIVIQEQSIYISQQKYLKSKEKIFLPKYFIKLTKFKERYEISTKYELRPIQNPESKKRPILIFGCSYAYGYVFDNSETISYIMSQYSDRPIINRAISGWGIQHMLYQLREDKKYFYSINKPKYIFYVLMDHGNHFGRLFYTTFSNISHKDYYLTYKQQYDDLVERKPLFNIYYNFAITRHIYNKIVNKYVNHVAFKKPNKKFYDFLILHFLIINEEIEKIWGKNQTENAPKFIILSFEDNNEIFWKKQIEEEGIKVINIAELIGKKDLDNPELGFFEPEIAGHPNGKLWKEVIPKLKEIYKDL